jgi:hypothetical protein
VRFGVIHIDKYDFPWNAGRFEAAPEFEAIRPVFAAELAVDPDDMDAWGVAYDRIIALNLHLVHAETGNDLGMFILHIDGDHAAFRSEYPR